MYYIAVVLLPVTFVFPYICIWIHPYSMFALRGRGARILEIFLCTLCAMGRGGENMNFLGYDRYVLYG